MRVSYSGQRRAAWAWTGPNSTAKDSIDDRRPVERRPRSIWVIRTSVGERISAAKCVTEREMSYCRWSTDDFQCDLYCYEDVSGGFTTHVAGRRKIWDAPLPTQV